MTDTTEMGGGDVIALVDPSRWDHPNAPQLAYAYGHNDAVKALAAQPSAGAEGEGEAVAWRCRYIGAGSQDWHYREDEPDRTMWTDVDALGVIATSAPPDTSEPEDLFEKTWKKLPSDARAVMSMDEFKRMFGGDFGPSKRVQAKIEARRQSAAAVDLSHFLTGSAQPDTGDVAALREALEATDKLAQTVVEEWENGAYVRRLAREIRDTSRAALSKPNAPGAA